jgi:diguanylate cyclase (GGDEF)-like protein
MRLYSRNDTLLIAGLTAAVFVVFLKPIGKLLETAREIETSFGLGLIPGLIILTFVLILHTQGRRQEAKAQTSAAAAEARQARERAIELERLVSFGQALARALDLKAIRDVVVQHLPAITNQDACWVVARASGRWEGLVGAEGAAARLETERERRTEQFFSVEENIRVRPEGVEWGNDLCFPMIAGGAAMGLIGLPLRGEPVLEEQRRILAATAAMLAIAVKNAELFRDVKENGLRDGLTGCFNRTHGMELLDIELRRARRTQSPFSAIMFDLDHFKQINDKYGHQCGDAVLSQVGRRMKELLRGSDIKVRYGGEEFLILLPETPLEGAKRVAETLRRELADTRIDWNGTSLAVSASLGVTASLLNETDGMSVVARADAALYRAKEDGRNCVRASAAEGVAAA